MITKAGLRSYYNLERYRYGVRRALIEHFPDSQQGFFKLEMEVADALAEATESVIIDVPTSNKNYDQQNKNSSDNFDRNLQVSLNTSNLVVIVSSKLNMTILTKHYSKLVC